MISRKKQIENIYLTVLGREADQTGLNHYVNSHRSLVDIQAILYESEEFKNNINSKLNPVETSELDNNIPIFIINLDRRLDKKEHTINELKNLGIKNYKFIQAVDGENLKKLSKEEFAKLYDDKKAALSERSLKPSEVGCALSHVNVAKQILDKDLDYAIVLEDDAKLTIDFKKFIKDFDVSPETFDFLLLGYDTSNEFFNGKLKTSPAPCKSIGRTAICYLNKPAFKISNISFHTAYYPARQKYFVSGTYAYVVSKSGAKKMLEMNFPVSYRSDGVWNYYPDASKLLFANPAIVHAVIANSDIQPERETVDRSGYSDNFKRTTEHPDFGT